MLITKRSLRRCLNRILDYYAAQGRVLEGKPLERFCSGPKNKRRIDVLEQLGAIECVYYEVTHILLAVYPSSKAASIEFNMGAAHRERVTSYVLGFISGLCLSACTQLVFPWLLSLLNKMP